MLARVTDALPVHPSNQDIVEISAFICVSFMMWEGSNEKVDWGLKKNT